MAADAPRVMILGGCGFIGRNLVHYLISNNLVSYIRVADKNLPQTSYLSADHAAAFADPRVEYRQANLSRDDAIERAFTDGVAAPFVFVFNCAGQTKYSQPEGVYAEAVSGLTTKCAEAAKRHGVRRFIDLSTAQVYDPSKKAKGEDGKTKPWTGIATHKLMAEEALRALGGPMEIVTLRPATVYGPGDVSGISPRIICAAVYKQLGEKMEFLWSGDQRLNTVHVQDVVRAMWHLTNHGANGAVYNLADKSESDQESINVFLQAIFGIECKFAGTIKSNLAKLNLESVVEDVNEKHLKPWSDLCKAAGIENTPLTPYLDLELLYNNHLSCDGSAIEATGFAYERPNITEALVREQINYFVSQGIFPASSLA
eukprot:a842022_269.p2 GENE.a842022_269~~a842022_269.p2  ORF type:complete len:381 (-),score=169.29 a842022_269:20-1132(-)